MEPIQIIFESFVGNLPVAEVSFHNQESMLYLASDRRLSMLNELVPVEAFEGISRFQVAWALGDLKSHSFQVLIIGFCNTLCDSKITGISV